jgi:hypothetical protein
MAISNDPNCPLLFMIGGDSADRVVREERGIRISGASDITKLLLPNDRYHRLHVTRNKLRQSRRPKLQQYSHLLNLITEAEESSRSLDAMQKLLRGVPGKIINPPQAVLRTTRDQVARRFNGLAGLVVPEVVRLAAGKSVELCGRQLADSGAAPPFILRQAGTHSGVIVGCFDNVESLLGARDPTVDHVAIRFVDFQSADGLYRKYRVFFIDGQLILRHMLISDSWNVHAKDRVGFMAERPELVAEERALFAQSEPFAPGVQQVLEGVRERMGLDFFGMDFGITRGGEVVLFEANATMNFFPFARDPQFAYLQRCLPAARRAFRELLGLPPEQHGHADFSLHLEPA